MSYLNWHVGMKVVSLCDHTHKGVSSFSIKRGAIYTIRNIYTCPVANEVGVSLAEMVMPEFRDGVEFGWRITRFRPLQKRTTNISIFNRILLNPHIRISEDA